MTVLPEWVYRIIDGLAEYEYTHPDPRRDGGICLANLMELVPKDVQRDASMFMQGARKAIETPATVCTCIMLYEPAPCLVHPERAGRRDAHEETPVDPADRERRERLAVVVNQAQFGTMPSDAGPEVAE